MKIQAVPQYHTQRYLSLFLLIFLTLHALGQKKYQSLLWEISGNGLERPSYLYGTMHVSDKVAFYLGDPFFDALESVDQVALELEPELWFNEVLSGGMMKATFKMMAGTGYPYGSTTQWNPYKDRMKLDSDVTQVIQQVFRSDPAMINQLLFRFYDPSGNFEEETWLDMYIYQSAIKLGKQTIGLETFQESMDMMEKTRENQMKNPRSYSDLDMESRMEADQKIQEAYRNGDLDALDSLSLILNDKAFTKYILLERNRKFIAGIDSLIRKAPLFAGVGAAHLPGEEGCIEMLRNLGYTVVPITRGSRDAKRKDKLSSSYIKLPLTRFESADGSIAFDSPYEVYEMSTTPSSNSYLTLDIANGLTFTLERFVTENVQEDKAAESRLKELEERLFEVIPGDIIQRKEITRFGMIGTDILHRVGRGDIHRSVILFSEQEAFIARLSGQGDKVKKGAGEHYINSLDIRPEGTLLSTWRYFRTSDGSTSISLPGVVVDYFDEPASMVGSDRFIQSLDQDGDIFRAHRLKNLDIEHIEDESYLMQLAVMSFEETYDVVTIQEKSGEYKDFQFIQKDYSLHNDKRLTVRYLVTGNWTLVLQAFSSKDAKVERFFDSLDLEPETYESYYPIVDSAAYFRSEIPWTKDDTDYFGFATSGLYGFQSQNEDYEYAYGVELDAPGSSAPLKVTYIRYPRYAYFEDREELFEEIEESLSLDDDLVFINRDLDWQGQRFEGSLILGDTLSDLHHLIYMRSRGNGVIQVQTQYDKDIGPSSDFQHFIEHLALLPDSSAHERLVADSWEIFLSDIQSADSLYFHMANERFEMSYRYPDSVRWHIYSELVTRPSTLADSEDKKMYRAAYNGLRHMSQEENIALTLLDEFHANSDSAQYQQELLGLLIEREDPLYLDTIRSLLLREAPIGVKVGYDDALFYAIRSHIDYADTLYPELLDLVEYEEYKDAVLLTLATLVDSGSVGARHYEERLEYLKRQAHLGYRRLKSNSFDYEDYESGRYWAPKLQLFDLWSILLPFYDSPEVREHFDLVMTEGSRDLKKAYARFMCDHGKMVSDSLLLTLLEGDPLSDLAYLQELDKESLWPDTMDLERYYVLENVKKRWKKNHYDWEKVEVDTVMMISLSQERIKTRNFNCYHLKSVEKGAGQTREILHVVFVYTGSKAPDYTVIRLQEERGSLSTEEDQFIELTHQLKAMHRNWRPNASRSSYAGFDY